MTKTIEQQTSEWLFYAQSDLQSAKLAYDAHIFHEVCFLAQQSTEKSLKSLLVYNKSSVPRIHSIRKLVIILFKNNDLLAELTEKADQLDLFYIPSRYPDALPGSLPEGLPDEKDAQKALQIAEEFYELVLGITKVTPIIREDY